MLAPRLAMAVSATLSVPHWVNAGVLLQAPSTFAAKPSAARFT